jgi:ADP-heptose:LPS heptosyltransferase
MRPSYPAKRFLIVNPFGIGDVLFSFPLITAIKEHCPESEIVYLCNARTRALVADHPQISAVIVYERDAMVRLKEQSILSWAKGYGDLITAIRTLRITACFDLSMNRLFGFLAMAAGVSRRYGFDYKGRGIFLTHRIPLAGFEGKHVTEWYGDVVRAAGIPVVIKGLKVFYSPQARAVAEAFMAKHGLVRGTWVGIAPLGGQTFGNNAVAKQWPLEDYAALIRLIVKERGKRVVLFGSAVEREGMEDLKQRCGLAEGDIAIASDLAINETTALIDACGWFISNDTGLLRIADACALPCLAILGPVDDMTYGLYPYDGARHRMLCTKPPCWPCYRRFRLAVCDKDYVCIRGVSVDASMQALKGLGL